MAWKSTRLYDCRYIILSIWRGFAWGSSSKNNAEGQEWPREKILRGKSEGSPSRLESDLISQAAAVKRWQARAASPSSLKLRIQAAPHGNFPHNSDKPPSCILADGFCARVTWRTPVWKKAILEGNSGEIQYGEKLQSNGQLDLTLANGKIVLRIETESHWFYAVVDESQVNPAKRNSDSLTIGSMCTKKKKHHFG